MSRIGKQPIQVPKGVTVAVAEDSVTVKGKKGELRLATRPEIAVTLDGDSLSVAPTNPERWARAMQGTTRSLLANMIVGVSDGYERKLEINGVGFEAELQGQTLVLKVGFNKPVRFPVPQTVGIDVTSPTALVVRGIDKQQVGAVAAQIRKVRKPEPYKGKGIKYAEEVIKRKASSLRKRMRRLSDRPRLTVFRSLANISVQIIDDLKGHTLVAASSLEKELRGSIQGMRKTDVATKVGEALAERAKRAGVTKVAFDRGSYKYHGRIKALADGARAGGLEF